MIQGKLLAMAEVARNLRFSRGREGEETFLFCIEGLGLIFQDQ